MTPGEDTVDWRRGFIHKDGGLWTFMFAAAGAGVELDAEAISPLVRGEANYQYLTRAAHIARLSAREGSLVKQHTIIEFSHSELLFGMVGI